MAVTKTVVMAPSPTPMIACRSSIEGRVTAMPPVNAGATSKLVISAPIITDDHEAKNTQVVNHFELLFLLVSSLISKKLKLPMIAMLKTFMPKAIMPPSAKNVACIPITKVMLNMAAYGPSNTARKVPPIKCPLVPNAIGKLIICAAKTNAAEMASRAAMERL